MDCTPPPSPQDPVDPHAWHHAMLHDLACLTMELAQAVQRHALQQAASSTDAPAANAGALFTRIARALRQTIALDARLATSRGTHSVTAQARRAAADRSRKHHARLEVRRRLEGCAAADSRETESLLRDLDDRLYDDDIDAALAVASITDIVVTLCTEFGLRPDYAQMTDEELGMGPVAPSG